MCIAKQMTIEWQRSSRRRYPGSQKGIELVRGGRATARRDQSRPAPIEKTRSKRPARFRFPVRKLLLSLRPGDHSLAPWLEHHNSEQRGENVGPGRDHKHLIPASG